MKENAMAPAVQSAGAGKVKKPSISRRLRLGGYSVAAALVLLVVLILLNAAVGLLPTRYTQLDLTAAGLYSIGEQTRSVVRGITRPVTIYWMTVEGSEDTVIGQLLDQYAELNDLVTVQKIDPNVYPNFIKQYTNGTAYLNSVVVESELRSKFVNYNVIYKTEYEYTSDYTSYTATTTFEGENALTGALDYVTSETLPQVYYLTGHGEPGLEDELENQLSSQNITVQELSLFTEGAVPQDCATLIIDNPSTDLYTSEADGIISYIAGGGKVLLLTAYGQTELPELQRVTDACGLVLQQGLAIETDSAYYYQYPYALLPQIKSHTITQALAGKNMYVLYYLGQGITWQAETLADTVTVTALLTTTDESYLESDPENLAGMTVDEGETVGPLNLAVLWEDSASGGALAWYAGGSLTSAQLNSWVAGNNYTLLGSTLGYLAQHESAISIAGKNTSAGTVMLSAAAASWWSMVYTVLLPLACVVTGTVVFIKRRALK